MKTFLLAALFISVFGFRTLAQNYISGIISLHGDNNTASGAITVAPGALFIFNNHSFYEQSSFINQGDSTAVRADSGLLILSGSLPQTISGRFKLSGLRLANDAGAIIDNTVPVTMLTILDSFSVGNTSNAVFDAGNGLMTLRSNILKTARIADLTHNDANSGNSVSGNVIVERYIRSRRAWHLLCPPTTADSINDQTIQAAWQEGAQAPRGQIVNPSPGYGTVITRPGSNPPAATGYDDGVASSPSYSLHSYLSNGQYTQPDNTDLTHFSAHAAYMLFVRGNRSVGPATQTDTLHTPSTITTLRSKGALHNGDVTNILTNTAGIYAGVSNPYACTVDFSQLSLTGIANGFYTWDPSINLLGGWVYIDGDDNYNATPLTPSGIGVYTNPATNSLIQSGQGFLVNVTGSTGTLTFREKNKNITSRVDIFRQVPLPSLSINLYTTDGSKSFLDGAIALFDASFSKSVLPGEDITKPVNTNVNFAFYTGGTNLMKEKWTMPAAGDTLPLRLWQIAAGSYSFVFNTNDLAGSPHVYLLDNYLHTFFDIQGSQPNRYDFDIKNDSASKAKDRFAIVFNSDVLPVTLSQIKASWANTEVDVQWNVQNENNIAYYEVERSANGNAFNKIGTVVAHNNNSLRDTYHFTDSKPLDADNYYRVKSIDKNGSSRYTGIAKVSAPAGIMIITVSPNPVTNRLVKMLFSHAPAGKYVCTLYTNDGKKITGKEVVHPGGTATYTIPVSTVAQGLYHVVITDAQNKNKTDLPVAIE